MLYLYFVTTKVLDSFCCLRLALLHCHMRSQFNFDSLFDKRIHLLISKGTCKKLPAGFGLESGCMHIPERSRGRCTLPPLNEKYFLSVWIIILKCIQKLHIMACIAVKYLRAHWLYIAVYTWHHLRAKILESKEAKFFCTLS